MTTLMKCGGESSGSTHYDDLHGYGDSNLLHVLHVQLFHNDQKHDADQGKHEGGHVGLWQAFANINKSLEGEKKTFQNSRTGRNATVFALPDSKLAHRWSLV